MHAPARVVAAHLCLILAGQAAAGESASLGDAEAAALAALRGSARTARALLAGKGDPPVMVVLASLALEEGDLKEAARLAGRLRELSGEAAETRLLEALLAERRARPHGDWLDAGLAALKTAHPLPETPPLLDPWGRAETLGAAATPLPEEVIRRLSPPDAFLVRWEWSPRQREFPADLTAMAIRLAATNQRLTVHLAVLDVLGQPAGSQEGPQRVAARRMVLEKLRQHGAGVLLCLALDGHGEKDPVTEEEVTRFEAAMAPDAAQLFAAQYSDLLDVFEKVDPAMAPGMAMGGAVASVVWRYHPGSIGRRVALSPGLPEAARQRLGRALARLAEATEREGLLLTTMLAASTLGVAAGLSRDDGLKGRVDTLRTEAHAMQDASRCLGPLLRLPIPSLQRAWAKQVAHERTFLERMLRQGLACPAVAAAAGDRP